MKIKKYIKLGECAICSYSFKKEKGKLKCNWDEDRKNSPDCGTIKECGSFPKVEKELGNKEV